MKPNPEALFHEARQLSGEARQAYLKGACANDLALRSKVEALLRADEEAASFLADAPARTGDATPGDSAGGGEGSGEMIDRYRLLQKIGEGGFGSVWMAEQREPVKRRVALKIIKLGMDTKQVIARFEAERQALAMMDHPNIAKVLDAGATETGRPYFVMELVRGVPILEYCDSEKLETRKRLDLFVSVCQAIQHAHQKGIIHRDIKPSNILVTLHDGRPVVKVIDFGIAKATSAELTTKTLFTEHRQMIGTPAYMSPEQAEMSGLDIDTRSDIYSLGVLLYELLTGTTPFDARDLLSRGFAEMMRIIREQEPHKPSTRLSTLGQTAASTAAQRRVDARKLSMILRGDLDWIVMKCLEKDRTRRYETASGLAQDIERHITNQPVSAGPPSAAYRARKFIRRNKAQVIVASLLGAALLLGTIGTSIGMSWALREKERADRAFALEAEARRQTELRADELEQVARYQETQLSGIDTAAMGLQIRDGLIERVRSSQPGLAVTDEELSARAAELERLLAGADFTGLALDALDENIFQRAISAIKADFADQPLVRARLLQTLASTMNQLGLVDRVDQTQDAALDIRRRLLGENHPDTLESLLHLGSVRSAQGRYEEADEVLRKVVDARSEALGETHPQTLRARGELATLCLRAARHDEAEEMFRAVLDACERQLGPDHELTLEAVSDLAGFLRSRGRFDEAAPYYERSLESRKRLSGERDLKTLLVMGNIAAFLTEAGRLPEAEPYYRQALKGLRAALGDDHPQTLSTLGGLGTFLARMRRYDDALPYMSDSYERCRRILGEEHPDTMRTLSNLATLYNLLQRYDEAIDCSQRVIAARTRALGAQHPSTLMSVYNIAAIYGSQSMHDEAERHYRQALEGFRATIGAAHPTTQTAMHSLGALLWQQDRPEGLALIEQAFALRREHLGDDHPDTVETAHNLGSIRYAQGEFEEAERLARFTVDTILRVNPGNSMDVIMYHWQHARTLVATGRFEDAVARATTGHERALAAYGPENATTVRMVRLLAYCYDTWHEAEPGAGHDAEAERWRSELPVSADG